MEIGVEVASDFSNRDLAKAGLLEAAWRHRLMEQALVEIPDPTVEETQQALQAFCQQIQVQDQDQLQAWLQLRGLSEEDLQFMAQLPVRWRQWCEERYSGSLEHEYLRRKAEFDEVTYSLLRLKDGDLAAELHQQLQEGEVAFEQLASQFSEGPEKRTGGKIGPVPLSTPHPALAKLLEISQVGQLWPPKQLEGWWIVVRLEDRKGAQLDEALQRRLILEQGEEWLQREIKQKLSS
jgi:parvulin-like peptidyl-prolyl isomerase